MTMIETKFTTSNHEGYTTLFDYDGDAISLPTLWLPRVIMVLLKIRDEATINLTDSKITIGWDNDDPDVLVISLFKGDRQIRNVTLIYDAEDCKTLLPELLFLIESLTDKELESNLE